MQHPNKHQIGMSSHFTKHIPVLILFILFILLSQLSDVSNGTAPWLGEQQCIKQSNPQRRPKWRWINHVPPCVARVCYVFISLAMSWDVLARHLSRHPPVLRRNNQFIPEQLIFENLIGLFNESNGDGIMSFISHLTQFPRPNL